MGRAAVTSGSRSPSCRFHSRIESSLLAGGCITRAAGKQARPCMIPIMFREWRLTEKAVTCCTVALNTERSLHRCSYAGPQTRLSFLFPRFTVSSFLRSQSSTAGFCPTRGVRFLQLAPISAPIQRTPFLALWTPFSSLLLPLPPR